MLAPDITEQIEAMAERMVGPEAYALDALPEVVKALNAAQELIKVEMLSRIAHGSISSGAVATGFGLACSLEDHPQ